MNFDYTYIFYRGYLVFEPLIIVSNLIMLVLSVYFFFRLLTYKNEYSLYSALFILMMGVSGIFGAISHSVHYQLGDVFFRSMFFFMNGFSLLSVLFCFYATFAYQKKNRRVGTNVFYIAMVWVLLMLIVVWIQNEFVLIKIHAALTLLYSIVIYFKAHRSGDPGSRYIVMAIGVSFFSILVHSLKFSFHAWFNYKDIAHVIMIASLVFFYKGIHLNCEAIAKESTDRNSN